MLSTILFIDDVPVGYEVEKQENRLLFRPTQYSAKECCPPHFSLSCVEGNWQVDGHLDPALQTQVYQDLQRFKAGNLLD